MSRMILAGITSVMLAPAAFAAPGDHFVENWDINGDGAVTLEEIEARRGDVFYTFDADGNGILDEEEYGPFDEAREADMQNEQGGGQGRGGKHASEGMTLPFNDIDGDGAVTKAEFDTQAAAWLRSLDRNGDNLVTSADFGRH